MKKWKLIVIGIILFLIIGSASFYLWAMGPKNKQGETVVFTIEPGTKKQTILKNLKNANIIRSDFALTIYLFMHRMNIQAGDYEVSSAMRPTEILKKFSDGDIKETTSMVTFIEGQRLTDYADTLEKSLELSSEDFLDKTMDKEYLKTLIDKYWFLTDDILKDGIYYPLEGYLFPETYEFKDNATAEEVITKILDYTDTKLSEIRSDILSSGKSIHDLITMASIVEKEANTSQDRKMAAQVFYTRLSSNWSLGSDVTAFYGAKKEMGKDSETWDVLNGINPYNTRLTDGTMNGKLPIGPICNPDISSINAAIYPSDTSYYFFVANVCTGEVLFQNTAAEFDQKVRELNDMGCI